MTLQVRDITYGYRKTEVLRGVSFEARAEQVTSLLGPNGSGKSTLIKLLARVNPLQSGDVLLGDEPLRGISPVGYARRVAYVPQAHSAPFSLSVRDAVLLGRTPHFSIRPSAVDHRHADEAIDRLGLGALVARNVNELSGGQLQRVAIARAVAQAPEYLLLDEPTSALDLKYQIETFRLVRSLAAEQRLTVLMTVHDLNQAIRYSDAIVLLADGQVVASGTPEQVVSRERISAVYDIDVEIDHSHRYPQVTAL